MNATIEAELRSLSAEQIRLVGEIWDRIATEAGQVTVSPAYEAELDCRVKVLDARPDA